MHSYFIDMKIRGTKYFVTGWILDLPNSATKKDAFSRNYYHHQKRNILYFCCDCHVQNIL